MGDPTPSVRLFNRISFVVVGLVFMLPANRRPRADTTHKPGHRPDPGVNS